MIQLLLGAVARGRQVPRSGFKQLTSKRGNKGYYKGRGALSVGQSTSKGGYKILPQKLPRFVVPDLAGFKLKPYIAWGVNKPLKPSS